jgi:uncharacterized protein (TIGR02391 family)
MSGLIDFAPTVEDLLEIEPEDLGLILVSLARGSPGTSRRNFAVSDFEMPIWNANAPGYPPHPTSQQSVSRALAAAMQWLQTEGLVIVAPDQPNGYFCLTRRGERLKNDADVEAYKKRGMLPADNLQPVLLEKVRPMFIRGDYELATIEAYKQLEISVRAAAPSLAAELVGVDLVRAAFHDTAGPLTDKTTVIAERKALSHLFAGAFGHGRNPVSHRPVNLSSRDAAALISLASYLLSIVDARVAQSAAVASN